MNSISKKGSIVLCKGAKATEARFARILSLPAAKWLVAVNFHLSIYAPRKWYFGGIWHSPPFLFANVKALVDG